MAQPAPTAAFDIPNEDIEAVRSSPEGGIDRQIRVMDMGSYNLAVGILHRGPTGDDDSPPVGVLHTDVTETYVIRSGSGTLVTGGTNTDPSELPSESHLVRDVVGPSIVGPSEGGRARRVEPGDVIVVPAGVVHAWTDIEDHVTYLSIRPDPDKVLRSGYVNPAVE